MRTAIFLWLFLSATCHAVGIEGRVVAVADGDTETALDGGRVGHKIRLAGTNTTK